MDNDEGHDDLIDDVADALTLRQDVDWERCARLVTPSNRWLLENLRVIARVAAACPRIRERVAGPPCRAGTNSPAFEVVTHPMRRRIPRSTWWPR